MLIVNNIENAIEHDTVTLLIKNTVEINLHMISLLFVVSCNLILYYYYYNNFKTKKMRICYVYISMHDDFRY